MMTNGSNVYDELSARYSEIAEQLQRSDQYSSFVVDFMLQNVSFIDGNSILDAGCGNGQLTHVLMQRLSAFQIRQSAFDISERMVEHSRTLNPTVRHDVAALPQTSYQDYEFDVIIASEVLEHLAEPQASLRELRRILKVDGSLIVTIPNGDRFGFHQYLRERQSYQPADDFFYTFAEAQSLFRKAGFRIHDYTGCGGKIPRRATDSSLSKIWLKVLNRLLDFHPDVERRQKRLIFLLKKDDYLLHHDF